jgi:hypothetical protein
MIFVYVRMENSTLVRVEIRMIKVDTNAIMILCPDTIVSKLKCVEIIILKLFSNAIALKLIGNIIV